MPATDDLVLELLGQRGRLAPHQLRHLHDWWQATAAPGESLVSFLVRQSLLSEASAQVCRQVSEGHISATMGYALLNPAELEQVQRRLPEVAVIGDDRGAHATITLLSGDDTHRRPGALSDDMPRVGTTLGRYLLTEWVGKGTTGNVFRALHPTLHIPVAIKVLHDIRGASTELQMQLKAEARLLARLNHPQIVRVYDFEAHPRYPYLVLEHVNGPTLAELIEQSGRVQPSPAVRIVRQLAHALAAAHRLGVVHRDIKPANVLLTRLGEVKLADLGLATVRRNSLLQEEGPVPADARVGTACYIAPELLESNSGADERSDIYSLGATFYHALTGLPPFRATSVWQVMEQVRKAPPPDPRDLVPNIPSALAELVMRMLAKDPTARPVSFTGLLDELALAQDHADIPGGAARPALWQRLMQRWRRTNL